MTKRFKSPNNLIVFFCSALLLLFPGNVIGQSAPVATRDPNAVALAGQSLRALAGLTPLIDITLQASTTYIAGSDQEIGPATLTARGNQESLVTLNLTSGQRQEIRRGVAGVWIGTDGTAHAIATHNCFLDADWFFPAFSLEALSTDPTLVITLVGQEVRGGEAVFHVVLLRYLPQPSPDATALIQSVSVMHLYLDAASLLPVVLAFNIHPDTDATGNLSVEIHLGAYQSFQGVQVPTRIQKYLQNSLLLDLTVTNATINSGVPDSFFMLPNVSAGGAQ